jgi:hypothetical protein
LTRRALATVAVGMTLALAGCGGGDSKPGLSWAKPPVVFTIGQLPNDRVAAATLRNDLKHAVHLSARRAKIRDSGGHALDGSVQFKQSYAHGLYGVFQQPQPLPKAELVRLGFITTIPPGKTAPVTLAYRLRPGSKLPVSVEFGPGKPLELPVKARPAAR